MENINLADPSVKALDDVTSWLSDAKSSEYGFTRAAYRAIEQFSLGNRDPLAKLLTVVNGKKAKRVRNVEGNKLVFASPLKRIIQHIMPNVSAKYNPGTDFGVSWTVEKGANNFIDEQSMATLQRMAALDNDEAFSPFSKAFKEAFPPIPKAKPEKDQADLDAEAKAKVQAFIAKMEKDYGLSVVTLKHMLDAKAEPAH